MIIYISYIELSNIIMYVMKLDSFAQIGSLLYVHFIRPIWLLLHMAFLRRMNQSLEDSSFPSPGDLEILSDVTTLRHLRLDRCINVTGNISAINTESLEVLSLSETRVFGSLRALSGKAKLRKLKLAATTVQGELSNLTSLPEIEHVDLSRTNVTGSMNAEWDGHCKNLQYLDLSETWLVYALQPKSFRMVGMFKFATAKKNWPFWCFGHKCLIAVVDALTLSKHVHCGSCVMLRIYSHPILPDGPLPTCSPGVPRSPQDGTVFQGDSSSGLARRACCADCDEPRAGDPACTH